VVELTRESFDGMRFEGDPPADAVIAELVSTGQVEQVNVLLAHLRANDSPIPDELPAVVRQYLLDTRELPAWADAAKIARAYEFFVDDGVDVASVLSFGSMVHCYAQPRPSRVLNVTHRLNHPHRRLSETSQFVLHMMGPDPFGHGGAFVPSIQKTRLIHAAVRHFVARSPDWNGEVDGVPICQQDLLGALMIFSVQVVDGMRRIGILVTDAEAEDYYHVWRVAGAMLGIRADRIPETVAQAARFSAALVESGYGPSPEGIALTRGLIDLYERLMPGPEFAGLVPAMIRQVVDPGVADQLEVPRSRAWVEMVRGMARLSKVLQRAGAEDRAVRAVLDRAGQLLLTVSVRQLTSGELTSLTIPDGLRDRWEAAGVCPAATRAGGTPPAAPRPGP
jgi:ER-bound oxygenase mpaB/B'/Rubber oxygenase, catalytic domain